jgi:hypothetical protein
MTDSPNIGLPLMEAAQAQKHVTHNEALVLLDALMQISVANMAANTPPSSPIAGARVVVGQAPTGAFAGQSGKIAFFDQGVWRFATPRDGWLVWSSSASALFVFTGAGWTRFTDLLGAIQNLGQLGVGTLADATNPLSFRGANALFTARYSADGGDGALRFKLNKENGAGTVSQLYQTNWSGRAETGLIGDNLWSVRRSDDGATWTTPLVVDTGQVRVSDGALASPGLAFAGSASTGLMRASDGSLCAAAAGLEVWRGTTAGVFSVPNSAIVGDNTGNRGRLTIGIGVHNGLFFGNRGSFGAALDGVFCLRDNAGTSFSRLQFGGTSASFPAIKRSSAVLQARLADDSAFAGIECSYIRPASFTVATVPSAPALGAGATIFVSNESGGAVVAFSDGTSWRRVTDRAVIS